MIFNPMSNGIANTVPQMSQNMGIASHMADGGKNGPNENHVPSMPHMEGLFPGNTGGRTDVLHRTVPVDSHVIPADIVSGLGEGNTSAGSAILDKMFNVQNFSPAHANHAFSAHIRPEKLSRAGKPSHTNIIAASGEYLVPPNKVAQIGGGDIKKGHQLLDEFILHVRKKTAEKLKKLPAPKK